MARGKKGEKENPSNEGSSVDTWEIPTVNVEETSEQNNENEVEMRFEDVNDGQEKEKSQKRGEIEELVIKCRNLYDDAKISAEVIDQGVEDNESGILEVELESLKSYEKQYFEFHCAIINIATSENRDIKEFDEAKRRFLFFVKRQQGKIARFTSQQQTSTSAESVTNRLKLSKIEIPVFDSKKDNWNAFKRLFLTYVHENPDFSGLEKHQLLFSKVSGESATLIEDLPMDAANYDAAWSILVDHYDDPFKTVARHLDAVLNINCGKENLRKLVTHFRANVTALRIAFTQNPDLDVLSQVCIHAFLMRSTQANRLDWERHIEKEKRFMSFQEFIKFMEGKCNAYDRAIVSRSESSVQIKGKSSNSVSGRVFASTGAASQPRKNGCYYCNSEEHFLHRCEKFVSLAASDRNAFIRKKRLCPKCFRGKCERSCRFTCGVCKKPHNTLLHIKNFRPSPNANSNATTVNAATVKAAANNNEGKSEVDESRNNIVTVKGESKFFEHGLVGSVITDDAYALLATALVKVLAPNFPEIQVRALLDSGSQFNLVTTSLAKKLNAKLQYCPQNLKFIGNNGGTIQNFVNLKIKSCHVNFSLTIKCLVIDEITDFIPDRYFSTEHWQFPQHLSLADPKFNVPNGVDLLLGLSVFWKILQPNFRDLGVSVPKLFATRLGWIVTGDIPFPNSNKSGNNCVLVNFKENREKDLVKIIERMWLLEEIGDKKLCPEENECEKFFTKTCYRNEEGRFVLRLPFKIEPSQLGDSKRQALRRFYLLEKRLDKDENLRKQYVKCIDEYFEMNHIKKVDKKYEGPCYYIAHHAVIKETSTSTKLRVVFDASMKTTSGLSLNDCLMVGPVVQSDLFSILLRARTYSYLFTADITKMYRQFLINERDVNFQRIIWRKSVNEPIEEYVLTQVTFGVNSSPHHATRCLKKLGDDEGDRFPSAKRALLRDFYMDDLITGSNCLENAIEIRTQLTKLLGTVGLPLTKWCSNNKKVLEGVSNEDREKSYILYTGEEFVLKTLGVFWFPVEDNFKFFIKNTETNQFTKREILSAIGKIFDPFGFVGPVVMTAKLIMQSIWGVKIKENENSNEEKSLGWDETVPEDIKKNWLELSTQLKMLEKISIPRHIFKKHGAEEKRVEIHGFCDASMKGYGAVLYVRALSKEGVSVKLLCSRGRVAPLKRSTSPKPSLPKLELCGAVLLAELVHKVTQAFNECLRVDNIRLWCDSEITLCWLNGAPERWEIFVANRVRRVQELTKDCVWDYVNTKENSADILSRGTYPSQLKDCTLWWEGPEWLQTSQIFSKEAKFKGGSEKKDLLKTRRFRKIVAHVSSKKFEIFDEFSSLTKLIRITAWRLRLIWNLHWFGPRLTGSLQLFELDWAFHHLVKLVQRECFEKELKELKTFFTVEKKSSLFCLSPFLDAQGLIRVGGRLQNSILSWEQRSPVVLPAKHKFTKLIIQYEHVKYFHAGPQLLRSVLRRRYWIIRQNREIQSCIHKCHTCIRLKSDTLSQMMAALPRSRVVPGRAFQVTGVDYFGPVKLRVNNRKTRRSLTPRMSAYVAVFVCFTTKAIHLELVSNLTSDDFIAALDRFVSRRGIPTEIHSDQGTTFIGAKNYIDQLREFFKGNGDNVSRYLLEKGCNWKLIPPHSPHFGGLWEAGVKAVKTPLRAEIGDAILTYEQYSTLLAQIEAILNSRPLVLESNDPNEPSALTPGHFLIGGPITALPNPDITELPANKLKYWELVKQKSQSFWKRWSATYLNTLQQRSKWRTEKECVKVGDVVVVKEDLAPPAHWPLGVVTKLHPGADGLVRVVTLRMRSGNRENTDTNTIPIREFKRPIHKLIYLPTSEA